VRIGIATTPLRRRREKSNTDVCRVGIRRRSCAAIGQAVSPSHGIDPADVETTEKPRVALLGVIRTDGLCYAALPVNVAEMSLEDSTSGDVQFLLLTLREELLP